MKPSRSRSLPGFIPMTVFLLLTIVFSTSTALAAGGQSNIQVFPPDSRPYGASYSQWQARFWQWAFSLPADNHPFFPGGNVLQGQSSPVFFLVGVFGSEVRSITIPPGIALFFPIINAECSTVEPDPFHGGTEAELRACAKGWMDNTSGLAATIDGSPIQNLSAYRHQSPLFTFGPLPENNILGLPAGTTAQSVDDGFYLMLTPLSLGQHTIYFTGTLNGSGTIETTYHVTVARGGSVSSGSVSTGLAHTGTVPAGSPPPAGSPNTWGRLKASYR